MRVHRLLFRSGRRRGEEGYVLATAVTLMFITVLTVMSVVTVQLTNIAGTRRAAGQLEGRAGAEQSLDQAFNKLLAVTSQDPSATFASAMNVNYAGVNYPVQVSTSADSWKWYDATTFALCSSASTSCVHFSAESVGTTDFIVEVTTRARCQGGTVDSTTGQYSGGKCVVTKYQQRMRKKQFFDYLSVTNSETSPFSGSPVAYVPGDVIRGPVRSNGSFYVCSSGTSTPQFLDKVETGVSPAAFQNPNPSNASYCGTTANTTPTDRPLMTLPKSTTSFIGVVRSFGETPIASCVSGAPACTRPAEIALVLDGNGNARYRMRGVNSNTWSADLPLPASRVLAVNGDVLVHGTLGGRLTIATIGGSVLVNGDLLYKCLKNGFTANQAQDTTDRRTALRNLAGGVAAPSCPDESLGLISEQDIRILCGATAGTLETGASDPVATTPACIRPADPAEPATAQWDAANRYMVGAWMAVNGRIATERWASAGKVGAATSVPNLYYYGSMTSQNRGVFGLAILTAGGTTSTQRGLAKQFRHDASLLNRQPPYFLEPTNDTWERVDLVEVAPCKAGLFDQAPQGAGC